MELKEYFYPLLRWWWLILASTVVAVLASFLANIQQPAIYQSSTTLMIGRSIMDPNPTSGEIYLAEQLALTYAEIIKREPIRDATMEALGLNWLPSYDAVVKPNSQLIEILVIDVSPVRAQAVAKELARQLILQSPSGTSPEDEERRLFINNQLNRLQIQINDSTAEIEHLQELLGDLNSAREIADTQNQINSLQSVINTLQSNYNGLLANTEQGAANTINIIDPANLPQRPIGPNKMGSIFLSGAVGFVLAAAAAYGIEFLDNTIKTEEEIARILGGVPILGHIPENDDPENRYTYVSTHPRSPISDAYRLLRVNLEFSSVDNPPKTIMIASSTTEEGKSTIATNLALIMAQGHKKVTLLDADFRRPMIHAALGIKQYKGLTDIFRGNLTLWEAVTPLEDKMILVLPTGRIPPNPAELLGSTKMDQILDSVKEVSDVIVVDPPPFLVPDASILASKVDGIILVVRIGSTNRSALRDMYRQIQRVGTPILGAVLNRVPAKSGYYTYYKAKESEIDDGASEQNLSTAQSVQGFQRLMNFVKKIQSSRS